MSLNYIEIAKVCSKCGKKKAFFKTVIDKEKMVGELGIKCNDCGHEAKLERVRNNH